MSAPTEEVTRWWATLVSASLVGTARASVPPLPGLGLRAREVSTEAGLLDAAALAGALRSAGRRVPHAPPSAEPSPPDAAPAPPERAVHLLRLVLTQPPVARDLQDGVLAHWCRRAAEHGVRVPHELLPTALALATQRTALRTPLREVLDARGRWLAGLRPAWAWVATGGATAGPTAAPSEGPHVAPSPGAGAATPSDDAWLHLPAAEQPAALARIRAVDPGRGRDLAVRVLATVPARQRAALIEALAEGLTDDDEPLLEAALDDRATTVRAAACALLDGLPGSARAARMADRLRGVLRVEGRLRKALTVTAPPEPDDAARRDGLGDVPTGQRAAVWHLTELVAGAPLSVLTEISGTDPAGTLRLDRERDLWLGVRRAVVARRDPVWARALLELTWDAALLGSVGAEERERLALRALRSADTDATATDVLDTVPGPWGPELSLAAGERVARMVGTVRRPGSVAVVARVVPRLDPAAAPSLREALTTAEAAEKDAARAIAARPAGAPPPHPGPDGARHALARQNVRALRDAAQYLSLIGLVDEAFT